MPLLDPVDDVFAEDPTSHWNTSMPPVALKDECTPLLSVPLTHAHVHAYSHTRARAHTHDPTPHTLTSPTAATDPPGTDDLEALDNGGLRTLEAASARGLWKAILVLPFLALFMLLVFLFDRGLRARHNPPPPELPHGFSPEQPPLGLPENITKYWGQYAPYLRAGTYAPPPRGCAVDQVNILHRHGARYPNEADAPLYEHAIAKLAQAKQFRDAKMRFLEEYEYALSEETLMPFGAEQSWWSGAEAYERYARLLEGGEEGEVYVRTTTKARVRESAGNWTQGFAAASRYRTNPRIAQVLSETTNNTLTDDCPAAPLPSAQMSTWLGVFAPRIVAHFEADAPGADLSNDDVQGLMAMCPFETLAEERPSAFCALFNESEWREFEYLGDVEKYYKTGYGNPLGRVVGVGYVNELLARLTGRAPSWDRTTHDASLPFPLGRALYADFSHENLMIGVFAALGLFDVRKDPPDPKRMEEDRRWAARRMVPFSARMVVERMVCGSADTRAGDTGKGRKRGQYVRVLVNDAVQSLEFCGADEDGLCTLENFVESQGYARENGGGDFEKCYR